MADFTPIDSCGSEALRWQKSDQARRRYDLVCGDRLVAALQWARFGGSLATLETARGSWTFKRVGFFVTRLTVRVAGSDTDLAVYTPAFASSGGTLTFASGAAFRFRHHGFWRSTWAFHNAKDEEVVTLAPTSGLIISRQAALTLAPNAANLPETDVLAGLAFYLAEQMHEEEAAAAAMGAVAGAAS